MLFKTGKKQSSCEYARVVDSGASLRKGLFMVSQDGQVCSGLEGGHRRNERKSEPAPRKNRVILVSQRDSWSLLGCSGRSLKLVFRVSVARQVRL